MYKESSEIFSYFLTTLMNWAVYAGLIALYVLEVVNTVKLCKINKRIKLFSEHSKKENFEEIMPIFPKLRKRYFLFLPLNVLTFYVGVREIAGCVGQIYVNHIGFGVILRIVFMAVMCLTATAMTVIGYFIVKSGTHEYRLYLNLFPPIPSIKAYEEMKREVGSLQDGEEFFETLGEKDNASENPNLEIFGEGDPELMEYVGGGKARTKEEFEVPNRRIDENADLVACPFCGSLNPKNAECCDFCGGKLQPNKGSTADNTGKEEEK